MNLSAVTIVLIVMFALALVLKLYWLAVCSRSRAIYKNADTIFADGVTASVDADNRQRVIELLKQRAAVITTVIIVTTMID